MTMGSITRNTTASIDQISNDSASEEGLRIEDGTAPAQSSNSSRIAMGDALDCAYRRTVQLQALMLSITGDGFEPFNLMAADRKHNLLWLVQDLADEIYDALDDVLDADTTPPAGKRVHHG